MERYRSLLVPVAGSEISRWVMARAFRLFEIPGTFVRLLSVIPADERRASDLALRADPRHHELRARLDDLLDRLTRRAIPADLRLRFGDPAAEILREAADDGHDLIVMGTHGRTGLGRLFRGSGWNLKCSSSTIAGPRGISSPWAPAT